MSDNMTTPTPRTAASIKAGCEERGLDVRHSFGILYEYTEQLERELAAAQEVNKKANRLYRALNGLDIDDHDKRAERVMTQWFDGTTVTAGNRASLKSALAEHFAAVAQRAEALAESYMEALIAIADDGALYHGVEGMTEAQEKVYAIIEPRIEQRAIDAERKP